MHLQAKCVTFSCFKTIMWHEAGFVCLFTLNCNQMQISFECRCCKIYRDKEERKAGWVTAGQPLHRTCLLHAQPSARHNQLAETLVSSCRSPSSRGEKSRGNVQPYSPLFPVNQSLYSTKSLINTSPPAPPAHIGVSMATGRLSRFSKVRAHLEPSRTEAPLLLDIPLHTHTHTALTWWIVTQCGC